MFDKGNTVLATTKKSDASQKPRPMITLLSDAELNAVAGGATKLAVTAAEYAILA